MQVSFAGADPRVALREQAELSEADREEIDRRLDRLDVAAAMPWTRQVLRLITAHPGVRAPYLAASLGRETVPFRTGRPEAEGARPHRQPGRGVCNLTPREGLPALTARGGSVA